MIQEFSGFDLSFNGKEGVLGMRAMAAANAMRNDGARVASRDWMVGKGSRSFSGNMMSAANLGDAPGGEDEAAEGGTFVGGGRDRPAHITPVMKPEEKEARRRFMTKSVSWGPTHETLHAYGSSMESTKDEAADAEAADAEAADDDVLRCFISERAAHLALGGSARRSSGHSALRRSSLGRSSPSSPGNQSPNLEAYKQHVASKLQAGCVVQF